MVATRRAITLTIPVQPITQASFNKQQECQTATIGPDPCGMAKAAILLLNHDYSFAGTCRTTRTVILHVIPHITPYVIASKQ